LLNRTPVLVVGVARRRRKGKSQIGVQSKEPIKAGKKGDGAKGKVPQCLKRNGKNPPKRVLSKRVIKEERVRPAT